MTNILEDARVYSEHAQKKEIDISDVKLAVQTRMDHSFTAPPPREVSNVFLEFTVFFLPLYVLPLRLFVSLLGASICQHSFFYLLCTPFSLIPRPSSHAVTLYPERIGKRKAW